MQGQVCTLGRCPGRGGGAAAGTPLLPGLTCWWGAGVCRGPGLPCPVPCRPGWIQPHTPSSAHPWVGACGWDCSPLPKRPGTGWVSAGKGLPPLFRWSPPLFWGLGMSRGIVPVLDEVITINYANQAPPAHPCLHNVPGRGEREAEPIYSLSRSLPSRAALSKESCSEPRSSRAGFASLRYDKIF